MVARASKSLRLLIRKNGNQSFEHRLISSLFLKLSIAYFLRNLFSKNISMAADWLKKIT